MNAEEKLINCAEEIKTALIGCDTEKLKRLYSQDYRGISIRGEIETLDLIMEYYQPGKVKLEKFEVKNQLIEVFDRVGIITGTGFISGSYGEHYFEHHVRFTDIFLKTGSAWQCYRSQATEITG